MTPADTSQVAVELHQLRNDFGLFGRDIGEIKSACAVLVERSNRNEQDVRDLRADMDKETQEIRDDAAKIRAEVDSVKRHAWMGLGGVIVLTTIAGFLVQYLTS